MLFDFESKRIDGLFRDIWKSLPDRVQDVLATKVAVITDKPGTRTQAGIFTSGSRGDDARAKFASTEYSRFGNVYRIFIFQQAALLSDDSLRWIIAFELAHVFRDDQKWKLDILDGITKGQELDPWVAEVLGECSDFEDFSSLLDTMIEFEARKLVQEWGVAGMRNPLESTGGAGSARLDLGIPPLFLSSKSNISSHLGKPRGSETS